MKGEVQIEKPAVLPALPSLERKCTVLVVDDEPEELGVDTILIKPIQREELMNEMYSLLSTDIGRAPKITLRLPATSLMPRL